jgi:hypothetical protein
MRLPHHSLESSGGIARSANLPSCRNIRNDSVVAPCDDPERRLRILVCLNAGPAVQRKELR